MAIHFNCYFFIRGHYSIELLKPDIPGVWVPFSIRFVALIKNACSATRFLKGFRLDSLTLRSALGIFQIYLSLAKDSTSS